MFFHGCHEKIAEKKPWTALSICIANFNTVASTINKIFSTRLSRQVGYDVTANVLLTTLVPMTCFMCVIMTCMPFVVIGNLFNILWDLPAEESCILFSI